MSPAARRYVEYRRQPIDGIDLPERTAFIKSLVKEIKVTTN